MHLGRAAYEKTEDYLIISSILHNKKQVMKNDQHLFAEATHLNEQRAGICMKEGGFFDTDVE